MGLLTDSIRQLDELNKDLTAKKITPGQYMMLVKNFSIRTKNAELIMECYRLGAKYGAQTFKKIVAMNLIGDGETINLNDKQELESIRCPLKSGIISRKECLDFSGDSKNYSETCFDCAHFQITRSLILHMKDKGD